MGAGIEHRQRRRLRDQYGDSRGIGARGPSSITLQPADRTINTGGSTLLKVRAKGTAPLRYRWYRGQRGSISRPVAGATLKDYTTPPLTETIDYWARIINPHGTVDSATAMITVNAPTPSPQPDPEPDTEPDLDPVDTSSTFEQEVVTLVNQHRGAGATCGGSWYPAVGPLSSDSSLRDAARAHSADMATNSYFSHTSLDGTSFDERI
jgi:hypothetical protein